MMDLESAFRQHLTTYETRSWTGEIGGQKVTLYAKPLTAADVIKVRKVSPQFPLEGFDPAAFVEAIALKASDAQGKLVVTPVVKQLMRQMKSGEISDIYFSLFADAPETEEDQEARVGNS